MLVSKSVVHVVTLAKIQPYSNYTLYLLSLFVEADVSLNEVLAFFPAIVVYAKLSTRKMGHKCSVERQFSICRLSARAFRSLGTKEHQRI